MVLAIYAGTFDPPTKGHQRALAEVLPLFPRLVVLVATNPKKTPLFPAEERREMLRDMTLGWEVQIEVWDGLLVDYKPKVPRVLIRGLRTVSDFEAEMAQAHVNKALGVSTVFIPTGDDVAHVSSSVVRELLSFGEVDRAKLFVPPEIHSYLERRRGGG
jgi:pantetheine-phosphate adenylyltransferase